MAQILLKDYSTKSLLAKPARLHFHKGEKKVAIIFSFKHMDLSASIEEAATEAIESVFSKMSYEPVSVRVIFSVNSKFQSVHLSARLKDGHQIELEQNEDNIYKAIELTASKLERELRKYKNRKIASRHKIPEMAIEEEVK